MQFKNSDQVSARELPSTASIVKGHMQNPPTRRVIYRQHFQPFRAPEKSLITLQKVRHLSRSLCTRKKPHANLTGYGPQIFLNQLFILNKYRCCVPFNMVFLQSIRRVPDIPAAFWSTNLPGAGLPWLPFTTILFFVPAFLEAIFVAVADHIPFFTRAGAN